MERFDCRKQVIFKRLEASGDLVFRSCSAFLKILKSAPFFKHVFKTTKVNAHSKVLCFAKSLL